MHAECHDIEVELTTRCNARCPQCVRNDHGGDVVPSLPITDIDIDVLQHGITSILPTLRYVRLCGTYGDPCIHPGIIDLVRWLVRYSDCTITINTNGGMRSSQWWAQLAKALGDRGEVVFGIDGLADTNDLYRIDVAWHRVMANVQAFNSAGGRSTWMFLVFQHNQHQITEARQLSETLGCRDFKVKSTGRFLDKQHRLVLQSPVKDRSGQIIRWLRPTDHINFANPGYAATKNLQQSADISCMALGRRHLYISAQGLVLPCGWLHDRFYGVDTETTDDHRRLFDMIRESGGFDRIDLHHHNIADIMTADFFDRLQRSWLDAPLDRCRVQCGIHKDLYHSNNLWHSGDSVG